MSSTTLTVGSPISTGSVANNIYIELTAGSADVFVWNTLNNLRSTPTTTCAVHIVGSLNPTVSNVQSITTFADATAPAPTNASLSNIQADTITLSAGKSNYKATNLRQTGAGAQSVAGSGHSFTNCFWTGDLTVSGTSNKFTGCHYLSAVSSTGIHNSFENCIFDVDSATALNIASSFNRAVGNRAGIEAGAGIGTINITGASTSSIVTNNATDVAITDAGVTTSLANNIVY
jgi:hypothetical protein